MPKVKIGYPTESICNITGNSTQIRLKEIVAISGNTIQIISG